MTVGWKLVKQEWKRDRVVGVVSGLTWLLIWAIGLFGLFFVGLIAIAIVR